MAEISWIKLKTTMFDDEKIRLIQAVPESDAILVIWIRLLVLAGKTNDDGLIYIQRNMPYTEEMLATLFGKNVNTVRLALNTLANFNMIDIGEDGLLMISNWTKHQNVEGMEKVREQNRLRAKKHYEKKKELNSNVRLTLGITESNATDIDIDKELDKEKEKENIKDIVRQDFIFPDYLSEKTIRQIKKGNPENYEKRMPIAYLNQVTDSNYKYVEKNIKLINARFNEGYTLDDFKTVIDKKVAEWKNGDMAKYLRPTTLFGAKFDDYLNQKIKNNRLANTGSSDYDDVGF